MVLRKMTLVQGEGGSEALRGMLCRELHSWGQRVFPQSRKKAPEMRGVLCGHGIDLHAEAAPIRGNVTDFRLGANLAFLDEEVQTNQLAFFLAGACFEEEPRRT